MTFYRLIVSVLQFRRRQTNYPIYRYIGSNSRIVQPICNFFTADDSTCTFLFFDLKTIRIASIGVDLLPLEFFDFRSFESNNSKTVGPIQLIFAQIDSSWKILSCDMRLEGAGFISKNSIKISKLLWGRPKSLHLSCAQDVHMADTSTIYEIIVLDSRNELSSKMLRLLNSRRPCSSFYAP